jgi:hypothetical protein
MAGEIDVALREEIVECQRTRSEFIRWKLILVAAVGAVALGVGQQGTTTPLPALLALIPLICVYVDSVCLHNDARIMVIAAFFRSSADVSAAGRAYETYCATNRSRFYHESIAVFGSSAALAILVAIVSRRKDTQDLMRMGDVVPALLLTSGVVGVALTAWLYSISERLRRRETESLAPPVQSAADGGAPPPPPSQP